MKKYFSQISKTLTVSLVAALAVSLISVTASYAQEITPTPGTYSYGSTSEFSPYVALTSSSTLAPTGDSQTYGYIAVVALLAVSGGITLYALKFSKVENK
jgi:hypothetical protein